MNSLLARQHTCNDTEELRAVKVSWVTTQSDCVITKLNTGKSPHKKVKPKMPRLLISFLLLTGTVARWQESIRPKMVVDYLKQHAGKKIRDLNSIIAV